MIMWAGTDMNVYSIVRQVLDFITIACTNPLVLSHVFRSDLYEVQNLI